MLKTNEAAGENNRRQNGVRNTRLIRKILKIISGNILGELFWKLPIVRKYSWEFRGSH